MEELTLQAQEARRNYQREYRRRNRDKINSQRRNWRAENRDKNLAKQNHPASTQNFLGADLNPDGHSPAIISRFEIGKLTRTAFPIFRIPIHTLHKPLFCVVTA